MVQHLTNTPIRPHPEQIVDPPAALFAAAAQDPDLRTGKSLHFMTAAMPLLVSPEGWRWRAGHRHTVAPYYHQLGGARADYYFVGEDGAAGGCSMFVYTVPAIEGLMVVKYVRSD